MENAFTAQLLTDAGQSLDVLPDSIKMQLGPFNPQVQDSKTLNSLHSLHASAFRLRYGGNYPRFPAHLIQHLQPQLFPTTVDQRLHFGPGAFRPFGVPSAQNKLFPSAFAPPIKSDGPGHEASVQEISPGPYVSGYYGSETDDDSNFRSNSERELEYPSSEQSTKLELTTRSGSASTPSPQSSLTKDDKGDGCNGKSSESIDVDNSENRLRRGKLSLDPASCPICGIMVLLGEAESHFFKELEKLSHITTAGNRDKKYLLDKYRDVQSCFPGGFGSSSSQENGHGSESGIPRGRWETYQRIKSNRLSRLRVKNRKKKNGDPICPVCNERIQGSVENINLHVEHCLKKHSDEAEDDEDENIDVEGDSEVYGEYEWTAGLLTSSNHHHHQHPSEKDERLSNPEGDDSSRVTPAHLSDSDTGTADDDQADRDRGLHRHREKALTLTQNTAATATANANSNVNNNNNEHDFGKFATVKTTAARV